MNKEAIQRAIETMREIHDVQRQPRYDWVIKPPMIGPQVGPTNVAVAKQQIATPRVIGSNISPRAAPTIASGAPPATPPKNLQSMMVYKFPPPWLRVYTQSLFASSFSKFQELQSP